jgi:hypothetical protein
VRTWNALGHHACAWKRQTWGHVRGVKTACYKDVCDLKRQVRKSVNAKKDRMRLLWNRMRALKKTGGDITLLGRWVHRYHTLIHRLDHIGNIALLTSVAFGIREIEAAVAGCLVIVVTLIVLAGSSEA